MKRKLTCTMVGLALIALGGPALGEITVTKVVEPGEPAPGFPAGIVYEDFGDLTAAENLASGPFDPPARIDREGNIVFHAFVGDDGVPNPNPFVANPAGIFTVSAGQQSLVAAQNDPAPGTASSFAGFPPVFISTPNIENGFVALQAAFGENIFTADPGLWSDISGSLQAVALQGQNLAGMPADGALALNKSFGFPIVDGVIYLAAEFGSVQSGDLHPQGFWRFQDGAFTPLTVAGMPAPGFAPGVVFGQTGSNIILGSLGGWTINGQGRAAFTGFTKGPGVGRADDEGIWVETDQGIELFLREGTPVPPGHFANGSTFSGGNSAAGAFFDQAVPFIGMNDGGDLVFFSMVDVPGDPPRVPTLWSNRNGDLELVFRGRQRGVAFSVPGDPAPGVANGTFFFPRLTNIAENGDIAVLAFVETNNNIFDSTLGIWVNRGGVFEPVAFEEGPVPDTPGVTFLPEINNQRSITEFIPEANGTVFFAGRYLDKGLLTTGFFRHDPNGTSEKLFQTRDLVDIAGTGEDVRTIATFKTGGGTTDTGRRVVEFLFTDGSTGIYSFQAVPVPSVVGDINGDGVADLNDIAPFVSVLLGTSTNPDHVLRADLNGDAFANGGDTQPFVVAILTP